MFTITKKKLVAGAVAAGVMLTAGVGYAYWTQGGGGSGSATAGSTNDITVNQTSTTAGDLYPGGPAEALSGNFDNPNAGAVVVSSVTAVVSSVSDGTSDSAKPDCVASDFEIGGTAAGSTVPSGNGVGSWSGLTIALKNTAANQDNCKGATANITYTANA